MGQWSGLVLLAVIAIPLGLFALYLRRPTGGAPRDSIAMKGKSEMVRAFGVMPSDAFDDVIRDDAADLSAPAEREPRT